MPYKYFPVRLVRACGSKPVKGNDGLLHGAGQARKSLWIETFIRAKEIFSSVGQARKSLWIETHRHVFSSSTSLGQARKSLWIETAD